MSNVEALSRVSAAVHAGETLASAVRAALLGAKGIEPSAALPLLLERLDAALLDYSRATRVGSV